MPGLRRFHAGHFVRNTDPSPCPEICTTDACSQTSSICVAAIIRINYLSVMGADNDKTWAMGPVGLWTAVEPSIGVITTCLPNIVPLWSWSREKVIVFRYGERNQSPGPGMILNTAPHTPSRLPTFIENSLVLRPPKEEDEIHLTTMATAAATRTESEGGSSLEHGSRGILVRSEVTQTVEQARRATSF